MRLTTISFGNLRRRLGKTVLLTVGLTIGVAMVVSMLGITLSMQADIEKKLDEYGANIVITPRSEHLNLSYGGVSLTDASFDTQELGQADAEAIGTIENKQNISAVAPKVIGSIKEGERSLLVVGVDFPSEFKIKKWWHIVGMEHSVLGFAEPPAKSPSDVILGSSVAATLGRAMGDTLSIGGRDYMVAGVLEENASQDDHAVFMALPEAQRVLGKEGAISMIEVSALCSDCPIDDIVAQISAKLPHAKVSAVRQAMTLKMQTVDQIVRFSLAVSVVVLAIGSLIVFVSMMSSVNERTKEIGVLRAIGFRQGHIMKVILTEAFVVSLASGLLGWMLGSASTALLSTELAGAAGRAAIDVKMLGGAVALALLIGMLSSVYPAVKASRLDPTEALRYI